jgi:sodium-dependent phosphate cotransporter
MYPLTLGANIGTTVTAILAALVTDGTNPLQVALAHLFFNLTGIAIFYPIPFMRMLPINAAKQLGKGTRIWRGFPIVYIAVMFFLVPVVFLGISALFTQDSKGLTVLGSIVVVLLFVFCLWLGYYCQYNGGKEKCYDCMMNRQARHITMSTLPEDMQFLKARMQHLADHTGLPDMEEEDEENPKQEEVEVVKDLDTEAVKDASEGTDQEHEEA